MKYLKLFETTAEYTAYTADTANFITPNVSLCEDAPTVVYFNPYDPFNGHEYVDLGLPSGTLWAKCNIGAETETDKGLYFAWGETKGYTGITSTKTFSWSDYKFNPSGDGSTFTKYNSTDGKTILDAEDDAAVANMGGKWHMPTKVQYEELINNTTNQWTTINGVNGWKFTAANGNYIFIPAAGCCSNGSVYDVGSCGEVWSSLVSSSSLISAWVLFFGSSSISTDYDDSRGGGFSVRGVVSEISS